MQKIYFLSTAFIMITLYTTAQEIDTLSATEVSGKQHTIPAIKQLDPTLLQLQSLRSLDQLLSQNSGVYIRSYGFNNMSTLSIRGSSAAQNATIWNGIPINNSANGISDLSLLNNNLFESVSLLQSGDNQTISSAKIGGILILKDFETRYQPGKHYQQDAILNTGSYGLYQGSFKTNINLNRWQINAKLSYKKATNNYSYFNNQGEKLNMSNAQMKHKAGIVNVAYHIDTFKRHYIKLNTWIQEDERAIPRALFETHSQKYQQEANRRWVLNYFNEFKLGNFETTLGFTDNESSYNDTAIHQYQRYTLHQLVAQIKWNSSLKHNDFGSHQWGINTGGTSDQILIVKQNNKHRLQQWQSNTYFKYRIPTEKLGLHFSINQSYINNIWAPLLPSIQADWIIGKENKSWKQQLFANIRKSYRYPTLNELYFFPGGNVNLKPEQGWSYDTSYESKYNKGNTSITTSVTGFYKKIDDWIYWLGGAIWTPHNIAQVVSKGVEISANYTKNYTHWKYTLQGNYTYTSATTQHSHIPNDKSIGKQIPYVPFHLLNGMINIKYKAWTLLYSHSYTGERYITNDGSSSLPYYHIGNVSLGYSRYHQTQKWSITASVYNIWNADYTVINARPMPGRNIEVSIRHQLFK